MTDIGTLTQPYQAIDKRSVFVDRFGNEHRLIPGYRSRIKPGWETMLRNEPAPRSEDEIRGRLSEVQNRVRLGIHLIAMMGESPADKDILVVGCDEGDEVAFLAAAGAATVTGSDYNKTADVALSRSRHRENFLEPACSMHAILIDHLRGHGALPFYEQAKKNMVDDNIEASAFEDESFDILCSWRTLEHLTDPQAAFAQMYRIVRPGGLVFHEYNPFFCIDGGHSLVTLDLPWGHARLDSSDLERYLEAFRPGEKSLAMDFYRSNLNRLSIAQMESMARRVGFEVEAVIPRARTEDLMEVTRDVFACVRRTYPYVTLNDLVCRVVRVLLRRP